MDTMIILRFMALATIQICIAIALYHMAERRFGTGTTWALFGLALGGLSLVLFLGYLLWAELIARINERGESRRIGRFMAGHRQEKLDQQRLLHSTHVDHYLDELLSSNKLALAEKHVTEQLRQAHEMGDIRREKMYREHLDLLISRQASSA